MCLPFLLFDAVNFFAIVSIVCWGLKTAFKCTEYFGWVLLVCIIIPGGLPVVYAFGSQHMNNFAVLIFLGMFLSSGKKLSYGSELFKRHVGDWLHPNQYIW